MKNKKPTRRRYANGTGVNGYIPDPNQVAADYDIMLAKAEQKANNNIGLKIVPIVSSLAQSFIKSGAGASSSTPDVGDGEGLTPDKIQGNDQYNSGRFMKPEEQETFMQSQYAAFGMNDAEGGIEVEGKEVIETPDGQVVEVEGASHEDGGVDIDVPGGTKIYSDRIKKFGDSMAERKVARENKKSRLDKLLDGNKVDVATKNTYSRSMKALEAEEQSDLETQEVFNGMMNMFQQQFAFGTGEEGVDIEETEIDPVTGKPIPKKVSKKELETMQVTSGNTDVGSRYSNITGYQTGVTNDKYGAGAYIFSPDLEGGREFISNSAVKNVVNSPQFKSYKEKLAAQIKAEQDSGKPVSSYAHLSGGTYANGTGPSGTEEGFWDEAGNWIDKNMPVSTIGDFTSLIGDVYSAFQPMKNTLENRAGDTPNVNAYKDFGKDALAAIEDSKGYIAGQRDNALNRNLVTSRGTKKSARNSARGANTQRAFDTASDLQLMQADSGVMDNFAQQMMGILGQQAGLENAQDQAVMTGDYQADLANRQDRDNFYTQKAKDIATKGQGIQQIGKDLNAAEQNKMMTNIINQLSKYGLGFDKNGNLIQQPKTTK